MEIQRLPDVQADNPHVKISLTRVGVKNVKKLVEIATKGKRPVVLVSTFDIFVDLPSNMKGANLSRNFEAMYDVLENAVKTPIYSIEDLCVEIAKRLLQRHSYAEVAEVHMRSEYMWKRKTPVTGIQFYEPVQIFASAFVSRASTDSTASAASTASATSATSAGSAKKAKETAGASESGASAEAKDARRVEISEATGLVIKKRIGAEVTGVTTCPCAQELVREEAREVLLRRGFDPHDVEEVLRVVPIATHNQRGRGRISIEMNGNLSVSLERIIKIIESSMSASTFELLKRPDEAFITISAHKNPKFVEDCVREMALRIVETFKELPDDVLVRITQINEESLHQHEAVAERVAYLGELRRELHVASRGGLAGGASDS